MATVGVIPAAGYARRLQPFPSSKETCVVAGKPMMDHLIERMRQASPSGLRVVTRPEKEDVIGHAKSRGATVVIGHPASVAESFALGLEGLAEDDVVLLGFPDTIWEPLDGFPRLLESLDRAHPIVLGLFRTPEPTRTDVVGFGLSGAIREIAVKPFSPASDWTWGAVVACVGALGDFGGEAEPGRYFDRLARLGRLRGIALSDRYVDIGTPDALRRATSGGH